VARVDEAVLTQNDLNTIRDSLGASPQFLRDYVTSWLTNELLYQEARKRGLHNNEDMQRKLEETRRQLAVTALLDDELYKDDSSLVTNDQIVALYNAGGEAYLLREDVANVSYALFSSRETANAFRSKVLSGTSWNEAILQMQADSLLRQSLLQVATRQYFTRTNLYPEELWKLARTLGKEEVSFVVKTDAGYYVMKAHGLKKQGEMPDLEYIKPEIRDRILIEERRRKYEQLLANLRARHTVEVRMELADTTETGG
jgi:peptidyl-prolyl cis-trans isomerase C